MSRTSFRIEDYAFEPAGLARRTGLNSRAITSAGQLGMVAPANPNCTMRVGFIGLDPIGETMASRLLKAGHQLRVYDPAREIPEALESAGGSVANSIQDACRWADAIFTMLPDDEAAEEVILGPGGVVECLSGKAIHIGSSTVSVECADRIVEAHWNAGMQYISAPVLVRSEPAAEVQLLVIAGGRAATIYQAEPLLSPIGPLTQLSGWPSDANLFQLDATARSQTCHGPSPGILNRAPGKIGGRSPAGHSPTLTPTSTLRPKEFCNEIRAATDHWRKAG